MTKKEAIKVLRTESIELGGSAVSVCRFCDALDMAVKALEDVPDKYVGKTTNAQKIRAMSDKELAKFLYDFFWGRKNQVRLFNLEKWLQMPEEED